MNTQVGYIICVHRAASSIFGAASKPVNRNGTFLFFEDELSACSECARLNSSVRSPKVHYSIEAALHLTSPVARSGDQRERKVA
jgi:hypothetical protein